MKKYFEVYCLEYPGDDKKFTIEEILYQWGYEDITDGEYYVEYSFREGDCVLVLKYINLEFECFPQNIDDIVDFLDMLLRCKLITKKRINKLVSNSVNRAFLEKRYKSKIVKAE